jgi:hypothetical protein
MTYRKAPYVMLSLQISFKTSVIIHALKLLKKFPKNRGILDTFAEFRKTTISFVLSACRSVRLCVSVRPFGPKRLPLDGFS